MNQRTASMRPYYYLYKVLQILAYLVLTVVYSMWGAETQFVWVVLLLIPTVGITIASIWLPRHTRLLVNAVYNSVLLYMLIAYQLGPSVLMMSELTAASIPVLIEGALALKCLRDMGSSEP
ncbi:MAG: hypothetical protein ACYC1M_16205 [Armatimonadota bacterium]